MTWMNVARAVRATSLGVWLGGLVLIYIAAPIVFAALHPDRTGAGNIVGAILHAGLRLKLVLAALALLSEALIFFSPPPLRPSGWRRSVPAATLFGALALTLLSLLWLEPRIEELRSQIGVFTEANANSPERLEFKKLHGISMGGGVLEGVLVLIALLAGLL